MLTKPGILVGKACEDVRIHHPSATAFLACGYPETRKVFYPPINRFDTSSADTYHEYFLKYDIKTDTASKLKLEGIDSSYDLILHGIDMFEVKEEPDRIYLFAVNHGRKGESIVLFYHIFGSDVLTFVRDFSHPLIKTPNAVAATSLSSFFITNDHYFYGGGPLATLLRSHEDHWGPFKWASSVVHCSVGNQTPSSIAGDLDCKIVSPPNGHPSANGALLVDGGKTLLINDVVEATTTVYDVDPETKMLSVRKKVRLGASADNLSEIPGTGDIAVAVFPDVAALRKRLFHPDDILDSSTKAEAAVLRLVKAKDYEPELLYWDDGSLITVLTAAAIDPKHGKMIAGGVVERHFIVCDIDV
ncbi:hypothetical protein A1O7_07790 [Cladophialophora yegresii CBS 114405]|uniref:Uncharacterized protein n=1 Tax=Cladophialophora yegresii CBS 114405 TaxID=1182544 RepID=W9VP09_9EURO|nr:uncharacterized protein A1O7_07790 [Cladophialophora yegresii CBS 114405]EXJ57442.1 hypothetical protein A1O7_07790 [Cladophialophora yegresii CBS 114405]